MFAMEVFKTEAGRKTWHLRWIDHRDIERRCSARTREKGTANTIGRNIELLQEARIRGQKPAEDLLHWLTSLCPPKICRKLIEWGIVEKSVADLGRKLAVAPLPPTSAGKPPSPSSSPAAEKSIIDQWKEAIIDRERGEDYAEMSARRVSILFAVAGVEYPKDITAEGIKDALLKLRRGAVDRALLDAIDPPLRPQDVRRILKGFSPRTCNHYLDKAQEFCEWLKLRPSPLAGLKGYDRQVVDTNREYERRAFTIEEQHFLLAQVHQSKKVLFGLAGGERYLVYLIVLYTGLRPKELKAITRSAFQLEGDEPTLTIHATIGKAKRTDVLPLHECLVAPLTKHLEHKLPTALAFTLPHEDTLVDMIRADVRAARAAYLAAEGLTAAERKRRAEGEFLLEVNSAAKQIDFYTLRHTYGTNLARQGVSIKDHMLLMRHQDPKTTMKYYTHLTIQDNRSALSKLSSPPRPPATSAAASA